jgi:hypothetical protein
VELPPLNSPEGEPERPRFGRWFVALAAVALLLLAVALAKRAGETRQAGREALTPTGPTLPFRRDARAPEGVRIRVEVLNATKTRGLARRATRHLRDRGFDVVDVGTMSQQLDTTLVLDRSGHPDWARLVADALGGAARVVERPDTSRYLDVTVQIGASWRPPTKPFYP